MPKPRQIEFEVDENECHICTSHAKDRHGYIRVKFKGRHTRLHRVIYEKRHGKIPEGLVVRHKCDNPSCINIDHLELGTHADNMRDMSIRGRANNGGRAGEKNAMAVLTEDQVREIKLDKSSTNTSLAKKFEVTHQLISKIRKGYVWSHVTV